MTHVMNITFAHLIFSPFKIRRRENLRRIDSLPSGCHYECIICA